MGIIRSLFSKKPSSRGSHRRSRCPTAAHMLDPLAGTAVAAEQTQHVRDSRSASSSSCSSRTSSFSCSSSSMDGSPNRVCSTQDRSSSRDSSSRLALYPDTLAYDGLPVVSTQELIAKANRNAASSTHPTHEYLSSRGVGGMVAFAHEFEQPQQHKSLHSKTRIAHIDSHFSLSYASDDEMDDKDDSATVTDTEPDVDMTDSLHHSQQQQSHDDILPVYPGLERFKLVKKMGEGAFSLVYHAVDTIANNQVAVKVIRKKDLTPSQKQNILKELSIHSRLSHPHIVKLIQYYETRDFHFLILELVEGGEIFHKIVQLTYFSEPLARHVAVQVATGIKYLHDVVGVVHRDIKPENLLFTPIPFDDTHYVNGRTVGEEKLDEGLFQDGIGGGGIGFIKIADFGLSKVVWTDGTKTPCGTVGYTAPEIVLSQSYTTSVDVWALGCVLYTTLCGFPPFYDQDTETLTAKVAHGEWSFLSPWWDHISISAKDLVSRLLAADPSERYSIDDFFKHPWVQNQEFIPSSLPPLKTKPPALLAAENREAAEQAEPIEKVGDPYGWGAFTLPPLKTPIGDCMPSPNPFATPAPLSATSGNGFAYPATPTPNQKQLKHYFDTSYRVFNQMHDTVYPAPITLPPTDSVRRWAEIGNDLFPVDERFAGDDNNEGNGFVGQNQCSLPSSSFPSSRFNSLTQSGLSDGDNSSSGGLVGILAGNKGHDRQRASNLGTRFAVDKSNTGSNTITQAINITDNTVPTSPNKVGNGSANNNSFELKLDESSIFNKRRSRRVAFEGDEK